MDFPTIFLSFEYSEFSIAAIAAAGYIEFIQIMMVYGDVCIGKGSKVTYAIL